MFASCTSSSPDWKIVAATTTGGPVTTLTYPSASRTVTTPSTTKVTCTPVYQLSSVTTPIAVASSTLTSSITCVPAAQASVAKSRNLVSDSTALSWSLTDMFTNTACRTAPTCTIPTSSVFTYAASPIGVTLTAPTAYLATSTITVTCTFPKDGAAA